MSMVPNVTTGNPGRTYKYYSGPTLYPFGYGLSYTNFSLSGSCNTSVATPRDESPVRALSLSRGLVAAATHEPRIPAVSCSVTVTNTGNRAGDEVVLVFTGPNATDSSTAHAAFGLPDPDPLAIKQVVDFSRISLGPGAFQTLSFDLPLRSFAQPDAAGRLVVYAGMHAVRLSRGVGNADDFVVPVAIDHAVVLREPLSVSAFY